MKRFLKILGKLVLGLIGIILLGVLVLYLYKSNRVNKQLALLGSPASTIEVDGHTFRDLNKNGSLDKYEDFRVPIDLRIQDLVGQMTLEEKAGVMYINMIGMTPDGEPLSKPYFTTDLINLALGFAIPPASEYITIKKMNSFNTFNSFDAGTMAKFNNSLQLMAERTRLGIPVTIATDPRHGTFGNPAAAAFAGPFSRWPNALGLAATRDTLLTRNFGDIARQEYMAVGMRLALHPSADLATEPRWCRIYDTFGEDAKLSAAMTRAYIKGFQGDSLTGNSVATMTKHFSGGGPQKNGDDAHFDYGAEQIYPGDNFDYHIIPFAEGALEAGSTQIMPYYGIPMDQTSENVGFGFNKDIITGILRDSLKFDGVVCTDWNISSEPTVDKARAWGVENLSYLERTKKVLDAGCDQFGGDNTPELVVELVEKGMVSESRINISVKRILRDKFRLGLFDNPYVDVKKASEIVGNKDFVLAGEKAQAKATVLLKNDRMLPLKEGIKIYAKGLDDESFLKHRAILVKKPEDADVIIVRLTTPFDKRDDYFVEKFFHQGRLYYNEKELLELKELTSLKPTIAIVHLERPFILTQVDEEVDVLLGDFGLSDKVLTQLLFGEVKPEGKLPFELPSSWESVLNQLEDVPYDSKDPLYPFGYGLSY